MSAQEWLRRIGSGQHWDMLWRSTAGIPTITHRNFPIPPWFTAMKALPGSTVASDRKARQRNLLIEWMVLLLQNTRADASRRKMSVQEKTPSHGCLFQHASRWIAAFMRSRESFVWRFQPRLQASCPAQH